MPRPSPFADVSDGPEHEAVVVELGRPTRVALGCFGLATVFLALVALGALSYSAFGAPGPARAPSSLRVVAAVLGAVFLAIVLGLATVAVRAVRARRGLAFDADAVWWRSDGQLARLPWDGLVSARLVTPVVIRGARSSAPRTPAVELCPVDEATLRTALAERPRLAEHVTSGEPGRPGLPALRFTFRLASAEDAATVAGAIERFAAGQWAEGLAAPQPAQPPVRKRRR